MVEAQTTTSNLKLDRELDKCYPSMMAAETIRRSISTNDWFSNLIRDLCNRYVLGVEEYLEQFEETKPLEFEQWLVQ
ncbi:MAG: hypothetical protein IH840_09085 [Candidatus Heimdallarchaeota archaeon]|nr:hypothetical protein [Candidatus Heimdallarchaeota archaeon]